MRAKCKGRIFWGCGGGIGLRADVGIGPYGEGRSVSAVVGADIIRPWRSPCLPLHKGGLRGAAGRTVGDADPYTLHYAL